MTARHKEFFEKLRALLVEYNVVIAANENLDVFFNASFDERGDILIDGEYYPVTDGMLDEDFEIK